LLNSTFIQSFELDDWHSNAPLHSNSILLPALFSAAQHSLKSDNKTISGAALLLSMIVGYETGPRVGLALHGASMLSTGWHSGAVFGPPAAVAAVSKMFGLSAAVTEDALGIACTQAGGLMSAQFESMVKRMQHGFAARNGLFAALMAKGGYIGIKRVFEREYGGYLSCFSQGNGKTPSYVADAVGKELGTTWQIEGIRVKQHSAMAAIHCTIECIEEMQEKHAEAIKDLSKIKSVRIDLGEAAFQHGGWDAKRPLTTTGAQMSVTYCAATQLVDKQVQPIQFSASALERDSVWRLQEKMTCIWDKNLDDLYQARVTMEIEGSPAIVIQRDAPRSVKPGLTNPEILEKWRIVTENVINGERRDEIEKLVLGLEDLNDLTKLGELLGKKTTSPIAD
jgi:aconitate decarboxylase